MKRTSKLNGLYIEACYLDCLLKLWADIELLEFSTLATFQSRQGVENFRRFVTAKGLALCYADGANLEAWRLDCKDRGVSGESIEGWTVGVWKFFKWIKDHGYKRLNPAIKHCPSAKRKRQAEAESNFRSIVDGKKSK